MDITHLKNYLKLEWREYISWLYFSVFGVATEIHQKLSYFWQLCYQKFSRLWTTCVKYYLCFTAVTEIYCTIFPARYFRSWNRPTNKRELRQKPQNLEVCLDFLNLLIKCSRAPGNHPESTGWRRAKRQLGGKLVCFPGWAKRTWSSWCHSLTFLIQWTSGV